ncbi:glycosyltransferase family 2 protein [Rhodoferax sp.]|uniref:glycosyltransferase family 2 protein n=1 Tax=Rhodoferax sp. TaxID=50421 RepID=UPI0026187A87|nr:glycosyltransferase family 2 protein [Rhodoferax sp.]MDD2808402.1 glycosyltransferase family 2 protein [Rhodoferax sp.]MDD4942908.1 glycosyltransferase family 2 protein [Rhodoferax sp.]
MRVCVVLLNWNGWRDTLECLDSLFQSHHSAFSVIVCDNASSDSSAAEIAQWADKTLGSEAFESLTKVQVESGRCLTKATRLALVANGANLGFAGGNNVGVRLALNSPECEYVWLLNNDTTLDADSLGNVLARAESDPTIGLCGSTLIYHHDQKMVQALGGATFNRFTGRSKHIGAFSALLDVPTDPAETERAMSYVVGAAMLVRRAFLEQVGLMQEDYFLYYEEIDWCTRGKGKFRLGYAPNSHVFHKEGASIGTAASGGSALSTYYLFRSRIRFTARFYPGLLAPVLTACAWDIFKMLVKRKFNLAQAAWRGAVQLPRLSSTPRAPT